MLSKIADGFSKGLGLLKRIGRQIQYEAIIARLQIKIDHLEEAFIVHKTGIFEDNCYYRVKNEGTRDGPFCSRCLDANRRLIRLHTFEHLHPKCPECKQAALPNNYTPPARNVARSRW